MKLDVSDLFDNLYDVASFARVRFDLSQTTEPDDESDEWHAFCESLSDSLFLPACANRAFSITHIRMNAADIKPRIISERSPETGTEVRYCRYLCPYFVGQPCFFASADSESQSASTFRRPKHKLTMWLGKLPPTAEEVTPPEYPTNLDEPVRHFVRQYIGFISRSPQTDYYEFHGDWCLRHVHHSDASFSRFTLNGQWRKIDELVEIPKDVFDTIWQAASDPRPTQEAT